MSDCSTHAFDVPLKSCPFCGGEARIFHFSSAIRDEVWRAVCDKPFCAQGPDGYTEAEAIAAWNTRAELGSGTCENANTDGYGLRFECSECGYSTIVHNCALRLDELPNYCPNCGAKVVDE